MLNIGWICPTKAALVLVMMKMVVAVIMMTDVK
jgi:hypothetical protein